MHKNQSNDPAVNAAIRRQIIHRVWSVKQQQFLRAAEAFALHGGTRFFDDSNPHVVKEAGTIGIHRYIDHHNLGLGDYYVTRNTHSVDRNHRPIYEGDVIQWTQRGNETTEDYTWQPQMVAWCHHHRGWRMFNRDMLLKEYAGNSFVEYESAVIGNIFENPELLPPTTT